MSNPTDEELEAEMEDLVKLLLDRAKGDPDQVQSSLSALFTSRPDLRERYGGIAVRKFMEGFFDEFAAKDARKDGKLN